MNPLSNSNQNYNHLIRHSLIFLCVIVCVPESDVVNASDLQDFREVVHKASSQNGKPVIEERLLNQILYYLPQLYELNKDLLKELKQRVTNWYNIIINIYLFSGQNCVGHFIIKPKLRLGILPNARLYSSITNQISHCFWLQLYFYDCCSRVIETQLLQTWLVCCLFSVSESIVERRWGDVFRVYVVFICFSLNFREKLVVTNIVQKNNTM